MQWKQAPSVYDTLTHSYARTLSNNAGYPDYQLTGPYHVLSCGPINDTSETFVKIEANRYTVVIEIVMQAVICVQPHNVVPMPPHHLN
jgi:hypothetical protein